MNPSQTATDSSIRTHSTPTGFASPVMKRISQIIFWLTIGIAIVTSIQAIVPSLTYYHQQAMNEIGEGSIWATVYVAGIFIIRNTIRLIFMGVGVLIYLRKPNERISVITSIFLIAFGTGGMFYAQYVPDTSTYVIENGLWLTWVLSYVGWTLLFTYFIYFPDGRPFPRFAQYHGIIAVIFGISFYVPQDSILYAFNWHPIIFAPMVTLLLGLPLVSQIYRYRQIATPTQRQQTKWVIAGAVVATINIILFSTVIGGYELGTINFMILSTGSNGLFVIVPITMAVAMLRYRLWDVDLLINRSIAYAFVAGVGLLLFFGVLFGLQLVIGQTQPVVAFVIAMISTALVSNPLRTRVQKYVDRHIYHLRFEIDELRAKHDPYTITNPGALSGKTVGNYQVLDLIGRGGMGEVYKASDGDKLVAIKTILTSITEEADIIERFQREGEIGKRLNHPNIANVQKIAREGDLYYLVMDYLDGEDLSHFIKAKGKIALETTRDIITGIASALDFAHEQGMIHRDLKPSNIMLVLNADQETYRAILMDFGISKVKDANTLTGTGAIGTIDYMAPEQIIDAKSVDATADTYALGIVAYEMLIGERPFTGGPAQVMFAHIQQPPPDPREINPNIPAAIAKGIKRALAKDPLDRYASAGEFAAIFADTDTMQSN